jgi:hypothetical protein
VLRDRRLLACLAVGVAGALLGRWALSASVSGAGVPGWVVRALALVPLLAGLVGVVLTGRPYAGLLVAVPTQLLAALLLLADFYEIAGDESVQLVVATTVPALALAPADAYAARFGTGRSLGRDAGVVAGALAGAAYVSIGLLSLLTTLSLSSLADVPVSSWVGSYAWPFIALVLTGLLAGLAVERLAVGPHASVDG